MPTTIRIPFLFAALAFTHISGAAQAEDEGAIVLREAPVLSPRGVFGRRPIPVDLIQDRIVRGQWSAPTVGDERSLPDGSKRTWRGSGQPSTRGGNELSLLPTTARHTFGLVSIDSVRKGHESVGVRDFSQSPR